MKNPSSQSEFRFTGKHMLGIMVAFFGVIIAVNFTMAFLATSSWTGLVVRNSYVASQNYNESLERARKQHAMGWRSDLAYQEGTLDFSIYDRHGEKLHTGIFTAAIGRPAFEQNDKLITLSPVGESLYSASMDLAPGVWSLQIRGTVSGREYRRDARLLVSDDGKGKLQ